MWRNLHNNMPHLRGKIEPHIRGITQSASAQAFNLVGIIAGSILANSYETINNIPWAFLIFPGLLSVRGAIGGLFSGRLSTAFHLGTIKPSILENTKDAYLLYSAVITLTWLSATLIVIGSGLFSYTSYGIELGELYRLFLVTFSTLGLSIMIISPTTFLVSIQAYNRGLNPDMVVYPITSTTADVTISFIYISLLRFISIDNPAYNIAMLLVTLFFSATVFWIFHKNRHEREYIKTIQEFFGTLVIVIIIVTFTGYLLEMISEKIGSLAEIYTIYPAMIDTVGDVGAIIGSTATTKLSLGLFKADMSSLRNHASEISYAWSGSLLLFTAYALISATVYGFDNFRSLIAVVWCTNLLVIPLIAVVSFIVGIVTFNRGLDPDNFVIPFETSLADGLTTVILYLMIIVWY